MSSLMWEPRWIKYTWERGDEEEVQGREWDEEGGDITETQLGVTDRDGWHDIT